MCSKMKLFSGSSNPGLSKKIAEYLGMELAGIELKQFSDGEISVKLMENVRGADVFILQSTSKPSNFHIMELLLIIDAACRASAQRINVVIPYFGYARQDRKVEPRVPISSKVVSNVIQASGANRIVTMDLHADQIQGFFDIPVDNLFGSPICIDYMKSLKSDNLVVVSPDAGGADRARYFGKRLNSSLAIIDKRREQANVSEVMNVLGNVEGKDCILVDDMIDTAGSISGAAKALKEHGAEKVYCYATHGVLSGKAYEKLANAPFDEILLTDTIPIDENNKLDNMRVLSVSRLFGEAIRRIHNGESVSSLFN